MKQFEINARPRAITGKQVRHLRSEGLVPLVVYGHHTQPLNIQAVEFDVKRTLSHAGHQLITLNIDGEDKPRMVLTREVQREPLSGKLSHVDLYEVDMSEKVRLEAQIELTGEARLVRAGQANLLQVLTQVQVECLPADIIQSIVVDISKLAEFDDAIYVKDLSVPSTIKVLTSGDELVVKLEAISEAAEEEAAVAEPGEVEVIKRGKAEEEDFE